jgi:hypothetical protein
VAAITDRRVKWLVAEGIVEVVAGVVGRRTHTWHADGHTD